MRKMKAKLITAVFKDVGQPPVVRTLDMSSCDDLTAAVGGWYGSASAATYGGPPNCLIHADDDGIAKRLAQNIVGGPWGTGIVGPLVVLRVDGKSFTDRAVEDVTVWLKRVAA